MSNRRASMQLCPVCSIPYNSKGQYTQCYPCMMRTTTRMECATCKAVFRRDNKSDTTLCNKCYRIAAEAAEQQAIAALAPAPAPVPAQQAVARVNVTPLGLAAHAPPRAVPAPPRVDPGDYKWMPNDELYSPAMYMQWLQYIGAIPKQQ